MKSYFRLYEECFFVDDATGKACIYNLLNGNVYSLSEKEAILITLCENNTNLNEIHKLCDLSDESINMILNKLNCNDLGSYYDKPVFVEKMLASKKIQEVMFNQPIESISRAFIILDNSCDLNCKYCNNDYITKSSCMKCFRKTKGKDKTSFSEYVFALGYLDTVGEIKDIYFAGGDLLNNYDRNLEIIRYAASLSFKEIYVFIGGNRDVEKSVLENLSKYATLILQIEITDEQSLEENKLLNSIRNINNMKAIISLLFDVNEISKLYTIIIKKTKELYSEMQSLVDVAIDKKNLSDKKVRSILHQLRKTSLYDYAASIEYSQCMNQTLTITDEGTISVCPRLNHSCGRISDIYNCLSKAIMYKYWKLNKDKINRCSHCGFRYICDDCRYIEYILSNDLYSMNTCPIK